MPKGCDEVVISNEILSTNDIKVNEKAKNNEDTLAYKYSLIAESFVNTNRLEKDEFFEGAFNSIFRLIPEAQKGSFFELEDGMYRPIFTKGYDLELLKKLNLSKTDAFLDFDSSETQIIDSFQVKVLKRDESKFTKEIIDVYKKLGIYENYISLYAPIKLESTKVGLICFENFEIENFSLESRILLKIYAQLISNFYTLKMHQQREREKYQTIIDSLVSAIEVKDKYTEGHAKRVSEISINIAEEIGITKFRRSMIGMAAILHDIGKIGIPTEILVKETSLTPEEYEIVKRHPDDTKKILDNIRGFDEIINFACMHHEHYDGSGYPRGLKGKQIPIEAQIIQTADSYDAMTSNRSYRGAMSKTKVREIFEEQRGKQFNPILADVLIKLYLKE